LLKAHPHLASNTKTPVYKSPPSPASLPSTVRVSGCVQGDEVVCRGRAGRRSLSTSPAGQHQHGQHQHRGVSMYLSCVADNNTLEVPPAASPHSTPLGGGCCLLQGDGMVRRGRAGGRACTSREPFMSTTIRSTRRPSEIEVTPAASFHSTVRVSGCMLQGTDSSWEPPVERQTRRGSRHRGRRGSRSAYLLRRGSPYRRSYRLMLDSAPCLRP